VNVVNKAVGGRSTKSFLAEGRLTDIERTIQPGDLLLIQFTHNDTSDLVWRHTDPNTSFSANLEIYVDTARLHGAIPVLVTPIPRRYWRDGELVDAHGAYPDAIRRLAKKRNIHLLDVTAESMAKFRQMGEEATYPLYMNVEPGLYPAYPGRVEGRHAYPARRGGVFRENDGGYANTIFQIHLRHLLAPFPHWRPVVPFSVALLRCISLPLARMKNSRRILALFI